MRLLTVVHDTVWHELEQFFDVRGIDLMPLPPEDDEPNGEHGTYYILVPRNLGVS